MSISQRSYIIMLASASFYGLMGITFSFFPQEVLAQVTSQSNPLLILIFQFLGACYIGFAMMNYAAKKAVIGGIYNRALLMGNLVHTAIVAITLTKFVIGDSSMLSMPLAVVSLTYLLLAAGFMNLMFTSPVPKTNV